jgi:hypothetical protein
MNETETVVTETNTVELPPGRLIDEKEFSLLEEHRRRLREATADYNKKHDEAKDAKKTMDAASDAFITAFDRFVRYTNGERDLPLFEQPTQGEVNEAAMKRSHVHDLCVRLKDVARVQLDPLVVGGWTADEIHEAEGWLDEVAETPEGQDWPAPPAFLLGDVPKNAAEAEGVNGTASELAPTDDAVTTKGPKKTRKRKKS